MSKKRESKSIANEVWEDVLQTMPEQFQEGRALVEARRRLLDLHDAGLRGRVLKELDSLAVAKFGSGQVAPLPTSQHREVTYHRRSEAELLAAIEFAVADGFSAPTDGSLERAKVLRTRALGNAERVIVGGASHLNWFARRRLRKTARAHAERHFREVQE